MQSAKKLAFGAALAAATLTGGAVGAAVLGGTASAQSATDSSTASSAPATAPDNAPPPRGDHGGGTHTANGITEQELTGDDAAKATAAAQAAVPDGTIDRVETDAEGATYEAHVTKADGSRVTVKLDASFNVTSVEDGMK